MGRACLKGPHCGNLPTTIDENDPDEIALECGYVVEAKAWIRGDRDSLE